MGWWNRLSAINISVHVNRNEFCSVSRDYIGVGPWEPYKFLDPACFVFADSDAYLIAWILDVVRLRVSHIYPPHRIKGNSAWAPKLCPRSLMVALLVKNLDPAITSVAHEDSTFRVDRYCVERTKLTGSVTG